MNDEGGTPPTPERLQVQVIARAAAIMRSLESRPDGLSLSQIAQAVGLPRSTVQRIAAALLDEHLLAAASRSGRLRLGSAVRRMAGSVVSDTLGAVRPILRALSEDLGETVDLAVVRGAALVFVDQVIGSQRLRTVSAVGETFPLYCTANGKAYLATLPDADVRSLLGPVLEPRGPATITDMAVLLKDLEQVRRSGVAFDREEHAEGISAVGVALTDAAGLPIAMSVPVPSSRFPRRRKAIAAALLSARQALSASLQALG